MIDWNSIAGAIGKASETSFRFKDAIPLGGGDINKSYRMVEQGGDCYFIKLNDAGKLQMFEAESAGLRALAATATVRVPRPVVHGTAGGYAFLVLEYLELARSGNARLFGQQLAALHRCSEKEFGFDWDNTLGETPQRNAWTSNWIDFWREQRLGFQLELAERNGYGGALLDRGRELMRRLPEFFDGYKPQPSLLHGDLWGGNHAYTGSGTPVIFDPAPYYGDREADLAMTELFGGFSRDFHTAYRIAWPLDKGYTKRKTLYNLYHILNHANFFHGGYARQAEEMLHSLLKSSR